MIKIAVSLFFALCLTLASSSHLMAGGIGVSAYAPTDITDNTGGECERSKTLALSVDGTHFCLATTTPPKPKTHHRCQFDIAPITLATHTDIPLSSIDRLEHIRPKLNRNTVEPALQPPRESALTSL